MNGRSRSVGVLDVAATVVAVVAAMWWWRHLSAGVLALDLPAYTTAAARLSETGSPYSAQLLAGPIANEAANVPIGYLYPPPLAQLFVLVPQLGSLPWVWCAVQGIGMACVLMIIGWRGGLRGARAWVRWTVLWTAFFPLHAATFIGNISGWVAIGVGVMLVTDGRTRGAVAAAVAILKGITAPLGVSTLAIRSARWSSIATLFLVVLVSAAFAPRAWVDWLRVLPNLTGMVPGTAPANLAFGSVLDPLGLRSLGDAIRLCGLAASFVGLAAALRSARHLAAIALAVIATLLVSATTWDHHAAILAPVLAVAWLRGGDAQRRLIEACIVAQMPLWTPFAAIPAIDIVAVIGLAVSAAVSVVNLWTAHGASARWYIQGGLAVPGAAP
jgi:hypothetical protein